MQLNPATTAVVAMHFQNDVVGADGAFAGFFRAQIEAGDVLTSAARLLDAARAADVLVIYTRVAFAPDYSNLVPNCPLLAGAPEMGCLKEGTVQTEIVAEVAPQDGDVIITNQRIGAFQDTDLQERLQAGGIDTVVLLGVATNLSLESTGRHATDLGYRTVVVSDASSADSPETHAATLASFGLLGEVVTVDDVVTALK